MLATIFFQSKLVSFFKLLHIFVTFQLVKVFLNFLSIAIFYRDFFLIVRLYQKR